MLRLIALLLAVVNIGHAQTSESQRESAATTRASFNRAVKQASPAVVNVLTAKLVVEKPMLVADPMLQMLIKTPARAKVERSLGSGVIVGENGIVVTNLHVIQGATAVKIALNDGREFPAKLVGSDEKLDLAVLRLQLPSGVKLPAIKFGNSDTLETGDVVLALGNPYGIGQSVSFGVVSAVERTNAALSQYGQFIQTDAAINPGNSGGALIDSTGALVGINTAIFTRNGGSQGIGFATPSNLVKTIVKDIVEVGRVVRPWLGAEGQAITPDVAQELGMGSLGNGGASGILITAVVNGSPAAAAGLRQGDVIVRLAGKNVADPADLNEKILSTPNLLNTPTSLVIWRGGKLQELIINLTALPPRNPASQVTIRGYNPLTDTVLEPLSPALNVELGLPLSTRGTVVVKVPEKAPLVAFNLALQPGDLLLSINGNEIKTPRDAQEALNAERRKWQIRFQRGTKTFNLILQ